MKKTFELTKEEIDDAVALWLRARKEISEGAKVAVHIGTHQHDRQGGTYHTFSATER